LKLNGPAADCYSGFIQTAIQQAKTLDGNKRQAETGGRFKMKLPFT
jgi:hypothetical protein